LEHSDIVKECCEAAFYSESTLNHYLRLFELSDYQDRADRAAKYATTLPENNMWKGYQKSKQGAYRKSYYKAAALIAALGETLVSNGMLNGKTIMIDHYKKMHSRKRVFKEEFEMLK